MHDDLTDPEMIIKSAAVKELFTEELHAHILSLVPDPKTYAERQGRLEAAYTASLKGDADSAKAFLAEREAIKKDMAIIHGVAKVLGLKDPSLPDSFGIGHSADKSPAPIPLTAPHDLRVFYTPEGELVATFPKVTGAQGYEFWACEGDPTDEANWRRIQTSFNCRKIAIAGLTRTKSNWLKIRALRGTQTGPWSKLVHLPPIT